MTHTKIPVFHALARSGSTLIARCVNSLPNVAMLGELHCAARPRYGGFNPLVQGRDWYGLIADEELPPIESYNFRDAIDLVLERCRERGIQPVLRDWNHRDFMIETGPTAGTFNTAKSLTDRYELQQTALARHPISQWQSFQNFAPLRNRFPIADFMRGYLAYAKQCRGLPLIRYEDFCAEPEKSMEKLCVYLGVTYDATFITRWSQNHKVTGDLGSGSRGDQMNEIQKLKPRPVAAEVQATFEAVPGYREALEIFGYDSQPY